MTDAIRDKVAIVGAGCSQFGENWDKAPEDMIVEAAYEAYADAGIEDPQRQIEAVFCGSTRPIMAALTCPTSPSSRRFSMTPGMISCSGWQAAAITPMSAARRPAP